MPIILIAVCIFLAGVTGCSNKPETTSPLEKETREQSILIGLIPERHIFDQVKRYEPLADYLSKKIGTKVKLTILSRYGNIIDNFVSSGMDAAFFGSFTYALAHTKLGVEVLARPEDLDGISTYHGLIFVKKYSGIKTANDMKGKRFVFVDKATTAGYLLPRDYFRKNGIYDYRTYLKESYFAGTHEDAIYDVLNGRADVGAAKNTVYEKIAKAEKRLKDELIILEQSPDVPENGLAVRKDLDDILKTKLKAALLDMHNDQEGRNILRVFGARRFIETTDGDYAPVYKYAGEIGLNLSNYDYVND